MTDRQPTPREVFRAREYLRTSKGHSCGICRDGYADCSAVVARDDAWYIIGAAETGKLLDPTSNMHMDA
jgi:hypothetical protein